MELKDYLEPLSHCLCTSYPIPSQGEAHHCSLYSSALLQSMCLTTQHTTGLMLPPELQPTNQPDTQLPTTHLKLIWARARFLLSYTCWALEQQVIQPEFPLFSIPICKTDHISCVGGGWLSEWLLMRFHNEALSNSAHGQPEIPPMTAFPASLPSEQCDSGTIFPSQTFSPKWVVFDGGLFLLGGALKFWRKYEDVEITVMCLKWLAMSTDKCRTDFNNTSLGTCCLLTTGWGQENIRMVDMGTDLGTSQLMMGLLRLYSDMLVVKQKVVEEGLRSV